MEELSDATAGEIKALVAPFLGKQPEDLVGVIIVGVCPHGKVDVLSTAVNPRVTEHALKAAIKTVRGGIGEYNSPN